MRPWWGDCKSCPKCGSKSIDLDYRDTIANRYYVYCMECRYEGGEGEHREVEIAKNIAINNWNGDKDV